jgi:DGQHR domain-containing protein
MSTAAKKTAPKRRPQLIDSDAAPKVGDRIRYSMSYVTQGDHRFYTLTLPSDVLASCSFATSRQEDPIVGFQRVLDEKRAQEIADYMDQGFGTIPTSIILSAQAEANLLVVGGGKTLEFTFHPHSFLILDGQHRVFGFSKAQTKLRIPAVIYNGLSKQQESRLFIDINTKQKPVPNELLLDIKRLADYEDDVEALLSELFDEFNADPTSPLIGLLSVASKNKGKISRVTFNNATKAVLSVFSSKDSNIIYPSLRAYVHAAKLGLMQSDLENSLVNPTIFRAILEIFPEVAQRVADRFGITFRQEHFESLVLPMFAKIKPARIAKPPKSHKELSADFLKALKSGFSIG